MSNRIPTTNGPDSPDSAYTDTRYRPIMSDMGIEKGDIVKSPNTGDSWEILGIHRDKARIRNTETYEVHRVMDSWFKCVELSND
jgi:hypothetical protein